MHLSEPHSHPTCEGEAWTPALAAPLNMGRMVGMWGACMYPHMFMGHMGWACYQASGKNQQLESH